MILFGLFNSKGEVVADACYTWIDDFHFSRVT
jgi:hypothetical protein